MCELSLWLCLYYRDCKSSSQLLKMYYFFFSRMPRVRRLTWKLKLLERRSVLYSLLNHEFKSENEHQGVNEKSFLLEKKTFALASRRRHLIFDVHFLQFTATGLMIIARNYLEVYPYDKWSDKVIQFPFSRI